jgi:hypothetical protein
LVSTLPGSLGDDRAHLLGHLVGAAVGTLNFVGFSLFDTHNEGEFFTTFLAEKFIGRHDLLLSLEDYWHQGFSKL